MHPFPAVVIGGPPHSGKSVLTYSLTQALRAHNVDHYTLRACPDGEGDWNMEPETITALAPILQGRMNGLERHTVAQGALFEHLSQRLQSLFAYDHAQLRAQHLAAAPTEITVELERLGRTLSIAGGQLWQPADLPAVLQYLPAATPLAIYGRGPGWLYAALARHTHPAPFFQFDARLGWIQPARLQMAPTASPGLLTWSGHAGPDYTYLEVKIPESYLDYSECDGLKVPAFVENQGIILSGKLPHWLLTGLVLAYHAAPWLGVYQPQLAAHAVVIAASQAHYPLGHLRTLAEINGPLAL